MKNELLFIVVFVKLLVVTQAFECWHCNSKDHGKACGVENPYLESKWKETCSNGVTSCDKITGGASDITYRQCANPSTDKCSYLSFECLGDDPCIFTYCCEDELCNGAFPLTFNLSFYVCILISLILHVCK